MMSKAAAVQFLPLSVAPPGGGLALLDNALGEDRLSAEEVFRDLRDGWDPTIYLAASGEMLINRGLWRLGRSILRGDREAEAERLAEDMPEH
jgi:hypothetical protein